MFTEGYDNVYGEQLMKGECEIQWQSRRSIHAWTNWPGKSSEIVSSMLKCILFEFVVKEGVINSSAQRH